MQRYDILIVGAGLGGLTAAAMLIRCGHRVRVFEQAPQLGEVGAGIQISANAAKVLHHLGLEEALLAISVTPIAFRYRLFRNAELVHEIPLGDTHEQTYGARYYHIHRADLHHLLARNVAELDPGAVTLGAAATRFVERADSVTLHFSDGSSAKGDVLIGADGIKSVVRSQIVGTVDATFTGNVAWRGIVPASRLPTDFMDPVCTAWVGPGSHMVIYYLRRGELVNFVGAVEDDDWRDESWTVRSAWEELKADFAPWHADVQTLIDNMDKDQCYRWALYSRPAISGWSTGKATLLGDAAHPTLPFMAQGAAMAIEDGAVLARCLEEADTIGEALDLYQRNRYERTARVQRESNEHGQLYHLKNEDELRRAFAHRDLAEERGEWLYSYDPLTAPLT